ncbi:hypothetical protein [Streptomyces sp. NPDC051569]|uniref:hypothetical protein n=1 Tax=Streptomyces sp. NPDC051569 TaxID=3365661 RepID=UPI00378BA346
MDPRELWERNTVLAEAFCASDERVRQAQSVLDEAQAERSRTLAAFAVTVGNDGAVADLMGLNEREVRVARRTVGRDDARTVAEELLARGPQVPLEPLADRPSLTEVHLPHPRGETVPPPPDAPPYESTAPSVLHAPPPQDTVVWSSSMDSVLLWSWKSGLDLQTVAAELGLDLRALLLRVQTLAGDGLLTPGAPPADNNQAGRHRRHHEDPYATLLSPATTSFATPLYQT